MAEKAVPKALLWCKSKVGQEHTPEVAKDRALGVLGECQQRGSLWLCVHHVRCKVCKRVLKYEWQMGSDECPDYEKMGL